MLRVNRRRTDRDAWIEQLAHSGVPAEATRFSPDGVRLQIGCDPSALPGFSEGRVTLQGEASQLVGLLLDPASGGAALDACAAPGGKTTQIAERLGPGGVVVAVDRSAAGLVQLRGQARRLGLDGIETIQADARALRRPERVFDACASRALLRPGDAAPHRYPLARTPGTAELAALGGILAGSAPRDGGSSCTRPVHPPSRRAVV